MPNYLLSRLVYVFTEVVWEVSVRYTTDDFGNAVVPHSWTRTQWFLEGVFGVPY